jgi:hypothetical protein
MLVALLLLGVGPASFFGRNVDPVARLALAPALGLCVGTSVFTTLIWFFPATKTWWVLPVVAGISLGVAAWRRDSWRLRHLERGGAKRAAKGIIELLVVCVAVAWPTSYTLLAHNSIGPATYKIADVDGYVMQVDGMIHESLQSAVSKSTSNPKLVGNLVLRWWSADAQSHSWSFDASALEADLDSLLVKGATQTEGAFVVAYLVAAGLGGFGAVRYAVRRPTWAAVVAGALFAGPMFFQLYFDGSIAAVTGMCVLSLLAVLVSEVLCDPRWANRALVAVCLSALVTLYPVFIAPIVVSGAVVVSVLGWRKLRSGTHVALRWVGTGAMRLTSIAVLAFLFDVVGVLRGAHILLGAGIGLGGQPNTQVSWSTALSWLFQTRGLYELSFSLHSAGGNLLVGLLVPLLVVVVTAVGARDYRVAWLLAVLVVVSVGFAGYTRYFELNRVCSYCMDRSLLPAAAVLPTLVGLGVAGLTASVKLVPRLLGATVPLLLLGVMSNALVSVQAQFGEGSYFVEATLRNVVRHIPLKGCIVLEGFGDASPNPVAEEVLAYAVVDERAWGRVSVPVDYDDNGGLAYFALPLGLPLSYPWFCERYRYVLTREDGVVTRGMHVISKAGAIALERRTSGLGVIVDYGTWITDPESGVPYITSSLERTTEATQFIVTGNARRPVYLGLVADVSSVGRVSVNSSGVVIVRRDSDHLYICLATSGSGYVRTARLHLEPAAAVRLVSLAATMGHCPQR